MNAPMPNLRPLTKERRRVPRVPFQRPARMVRGDRSTPVRVVDLSARGALLVLPFGACVRPGAPLRLEIDSAGRTICIPARVVHLRGSRVGLRCGALTVEDQTALAALVERELGSADMLDRALCVMGGR